MLGHSPQDDLRSIDIRHGMKMHRSLDRMMDLHGPAEVLLYVGMYRNSLEWRHADELMEVLARYHARHWPKTDVTYRKDPQ